MSLSGLGVLLQVEVAERLRDAEATAFQGEREMAALQDIMDHMVSPSFALSRGMSLTPAAVKQRYAPTFVVCKSVGVCLR